MEKNLTALEAAMRRALPVDEKDLRAYSPLTLAFIGDGIYVLLIRTLVVTDYRCSVNRLHQRTAHYVKASAQSRMIESIYSLLDEEEQAIYRRGRNAKMATMAKHATMMEYKRATGFEALMGYLYLKGDYSRLCFLVRKGLEAVHAHFQGMEQVE